MPYRQNFPIPSVINPPRSCLCLPIPDSPEWRAVLAGLLSELTLWFNYERTGDNSGAQCAAVWKEIFTEIDWSDMSCCCDQAPLQFIWIDDGVLVVVDPDTGTQTPAPQYDPRNYSVIVPPLTGDDGADKRCVAAASMVALIKEQVGDQLTDDMSRYTLAQLITDWVNTMLQTSNIFLSLLTVIANQIFALVIATLRPLLTEDVYDQLECIFYCNMADDASFDGVQWQATRTAITGDIGGIVGVFFEHLVFLLGVAGMTNLARSGAASSADCSDCDCSNVCDVTHWSILTGFGAQGVIDSVDVDAGTITCSTNGAQDNGRYYITLVSDNADTCCSMSTAQVTVDTGSIEGTAYWPCGWPLGDFSGYAGLGGVSVCVNKLQPESPTPFTVTFLMLPCP